MKPTYKFSDKSINSFNATFRNYLAVSGRKLFESINEKAYFILGGSPNTQGAIKLTDKADANRIRKDLGMERVQQIGKRGKKIKKWKTEFSGQYNNSLATILVISNLRKKGLPIPPAAILQKMAKKLTARRLSSVGFIRSGWLVALKRFSKFSRVGRTKFAKGEVAKPMGVKKGGVKTATEKSPVAVFWNSAGGESKHKGALLRHGQTALQEAFNQETRSMNSYIEKKLRESAKVVGIRTN